MDIKKLTATFLIIGGSITTGALLWWLNFYGQITRELGGTIGEAFSCLYSSGGECGFVIELAQLGGFTPYNPISFWVGVVLLGIGIILKFSLKKKEDAVE